MDEKIYTIPVNEAFEQHDDCPFCLLYEKLQETEIDRIMGASMMDPDIRISTNELGFCKKHFEQMLSKGNRLSLALTIQTHLDEVRNDLKPPKVFGDAGAKQTKRIEKLNNDCYVCGRINLHFPKMFETACILFEREREFRDKFERQKFFCLPHYKKLLEASKKMNSKRYYGDLVDMAYKIMGAYLDSLYDDVSHFCKKFDYNYRDAPWGNSKDSIERSIKFLSSKE